LQTGIIDYFEVPIKYIELILKHNSEMKFNHTVKDIKIKTDFCEVITENESFNSKFVVTCAGLQSNRIEKISYPNLPLRIIPFRGEYYKLKNEKNII
jgi:L-2-hydroxyglutarate oxidase